MIDYRKEAKGRHCKACIPGVCNHNPETTVLHHIRRGNQKIDKLGAWVCSNCHDWFHHQWVIYNDGKPCLKAQRDLWELEAMFRTQLALHEEGKL